MTRGSPPWTGPARLRVRDLGIAAGIACTALVWLLSRRRRRPPPVAPSPALAARRTAALEGLEWLSLLTGVASRGGGSPLHVFVTVLEGGRTERHLLRLLLLGGSFLFRRWRTGRLLPRTGIELPVVLLLVGQALPHVLMRDGRRYLPKAVRTAAALGMYDALLEGSRRTRALVATGVAVNAALLALSWPTTWDFSDFPAYYAPLQRVGLAINRHVRSLGPSVRKNQVASVIAQSLPVAFALARDHWIQRRQRSIARVAFFAALPLLCCGGLALTFSRMTWLATAATPVILGLAATLRRWRPATSTRVIVWIFAPLVSVLALVTLVRNASTVVTILRRLSEPNRSFDNRWNLAKAGVALIRDYPYTGVGHESLTSVHAHYHLLHHVPRYSQPHNVYLNTWLEDGALGAIGLAWGALTCLEWGWRASGERDLSPLAVGGFGALTIGGIMGLTNDYFVHGVRNDHHTIDWRRARTLLLPGTMLGIAGAFARAGLPDDAASIRASWIPVLGGALLGSWGLHRRHALIAAWHANVGALLQTRLELRRYDPTRFDRPLLDEIRRDAALAPAVARFRRALAWDPGNVTALQRLGTIALSRGEYDEAGRLLRQAWDAGHRDRVTRLLYGDVLVAEGREADAVTIVRGLELAASRLLFQAWYRYEIGGDPTRAAQARRAAALLHADGGD